MKINYPACITSHLLPGVRIGNGEVAIEYSNRAGRDGRTRYRWTISFDGNEFTGDDLQSGCQGGSLKGGLESLLSFLGACAESYGYKMRNPQSEPENLDLFPSEVAEWAYQNADEISIAELELSDTPGAIIE